MAKFLVQASYSVEGTQGLLKEGGSKRRAAIQDAVQALGGKLEAIYFALGDTDVFLIVEAPDAASVMGLSMVARAAGALSTGKTTQLFTAEEMDKAVKAKINYRKPGQ
jgi:uncharacterized protein with GYD domain